MAKDYVHLTSGERERIMQLRREKRSLGFIANALSRSKSTISLELKRNTHNGSYEADRAQSKARRRGKCPRRKCKMLIPEIERFVKSGLKKDWSPEQIAGRMKRVCRRSTVCSVSHQSIYRWICNDKKAGGKWYTHLRLNNRKQHRPRGVKRNSDARIAERIMIDKRPKSVDSKRYFGDWEGDTVQGKQGCGRLVTLAERKSLYAVFAPLESKHAAKLNAAVVERMKRSPLLPFRTLTVDNGLEFAGHRELSFALKGAIYFAHPQSSWERGLNENMNGLLRQYFPKGIDFRTVAAQRVAEVEELLNNRPRKTLGYRTPAEVMNQYLARARRRMGVRLGT